MGIFPDDLEQVYDNVTEHKIASEEVTSKLIKDWLEQRKVVSQSFMSVLEYPSLETMIYKKSYCFVKAIRLRQMRW